MPLKSEPSHFYAPSRSASDPHTLVPLISAIIVTTAVSLLFLLLPSIDIAVSDLFFQPGLGFPAASNVSLKLLRSLGLLSINASIGVVVGMTLVRCLLPARWMPTMLFNIRPRTLIFLTATAALGPGLITNIIFKDHWGRARPIETTLFGGTHSFSLPWVISDGCTRNCSFVSGEGSGVFWLVAILFVAPKRIRLPLALVTCAWVSLISLNRIAFGGHFLSDVLIGWGLMLIVMLVLRAIVLVRYGARIDAGIARWVGPKARMNP